MLVKFYGELERYSELEIAKTTLREIISIMKLHWGEEFTSTLVNNPFIYVVTKGAEENPEISTLLTPEICTSDLSDYDTLHIFPEISGDIPVPFILAAALASLSGGLLSVGAASLVLATIGNMLIAMALNMLMSALSPTPEFANDPQVTQNKKNKSNLFNGAPLIRDQGGSVPLIYGNPFCGAVLISSGVFTEEV